MSEIVYKSFNLKADEATEGFVEAFVSTFGVVDSQGDIVEFGAYKESLAAKMPSIALSHDWTQVIGKGLSGEEVPPNDPRLPEAIKQYGALLLKFQLNLDVQAGRETYSNIKFGALTEFSVGILPEEVKWENVENSEYPVRVIKKAKLGEVSPVIRGASPDTSIVTIKANELKTDEQLTTAIDETIALIIKCLNWTKAHGEMRFKAGRKISEARLSRLKELVTLFNQGSADLQTIIDEANVSKSDRAKHALLNYISTL